MTGAGDQPALQQLFAAIVAGEDEALALLAATPALAGVSSAAGASRAAARQWFVAEIGHYIYEGDTALHVAAAAYRAAVVQGLIRAGADVEAPNRRGARPLHYAADGAPGNPRRDHDAQGETIRALLAAGAEPNAVDRNGATPLHRAVRTRSAAAVAALLEGGADPLRRNKNGSTAADLASRTTGKGGSGSPEAKTQQAAIVALLEQHGASTAPPTSFVHS